MASLGFRQPSSIGEEATWEIYSPLGFVTSVSELLESNSELGGLDGTCSSLLRCFQLLESSLRKLESKTIALTGESYFISVSVDRLNGHCSGCG